MSKKVSFPQVEVCGTFVQVRHLLSKVRWKSPEYKALMLRWQEICRTKIREIQCLVEDPPSVLCLKFRRLYQQCPSGSPEEAVAYGYWQAYEPYDPELRSYRTLIKEVAFQRGRDLGLFF